MWSPTIQHHNWISCNHIEHLQPHRTPSIETSVTTSPRATQPASIKNLFANFYHSNQTITVAMQVFSRAVILSLVGIALAAPGPSRLDLDSPTLMVRQEDSEIVRTIEVVTKMEEALGELDWVSTLSGGQLLTVPTAEWGQYVDIVKAEHEMQRNQERALQKRSIRVSGGIDGRWAEYGCYTTGEIMPGEGLRQFSTEVDLACGDFVYSLQSQVQVRTGTIIPNTGGLRWFLKFENWGKLNYAWNKAKCVDAMNKALDLCQDSSLNTRGGWLDVYTGLQQNTQTRGDKALSFTVDPIA